MRSSSDSPFAGSNVCTTSPKTRAKDGSERPVKPEQIAPIIQKTLYFGSIKLSISVVVLNSGISSFFTSDYLSLSSSSAAVTFPPSFVSYCL